MKLHPKNQCQKQNHPFAYLTGPIQSSPSSTLHTIMQFQMGPSFLARCSSCLDSTHHAHQSQWNHRHFGRSKIADNRWRVSNLNKFATHCNPIQIRAFLRCHTQFAEGGRRPDSLPVTSVPKNSTDDDWRQGCAATATALFATPFIHQLNPELRFRKWQNPAYPERLSSSPMDGNEIGCRQGVKLVISALKGSQFHYGIPSESWVEWKIARI